MLFLKKKIRIFIYLFLIFSFFMQVKAIAGETLAHVRLEYQNTIDLLTTGKDDHIVFLLSEWSNYVSKISGYSNKEYLEAIQELQTEYYHSIAENEQISRELKKKRKNHTSDWLSDLINRFGETYIRKNREAVLVNIGLVFKRINEKYFRTADEHLVYKEAELYAVYRNYFSWFSDFYHGLKKEEQDQLKSRKDAVDAFLSMIDKFSITYILVASKSQPSQILYKLKAIRLNKELYDYFRTYPFQDGFNPLKASGDLDKLINDGKVKK